MFSWLFNVFSKREEVAINSNRIPLTVEFRNRVMMLFRDYFQYSFDDFLTQLHNKVSYLHGKMRLTNMGPNTSQSDDLLEFLFKCKDEHFLDVLEIVFHSGLKGITWPDNKLIPSINEFFLVDNLPYFLTNFSTEEYEETYLGTTSKGIRITGFPTVIPKESEVLHQKAILPALVLLSGKEYKQANDEFLNALTDFRKGDFRDCVTKCGSTFESVMKVLCSKKSIPFKNNDTASVLLKALISHSKLDGFWEQPLILIATVRNRLSSAHGAGLEQKKISEHVAIYIINATASAILLLVGEFA